MDSNKKQKLIIVVLATLILILTIVIIVILCKKVSSSEKVDNKKDKNEIEKKISIKTEDLYGQEKNMLIEKIKEINKFSKNYPFDNVSKINNQEVLYKIIVELGFGQPISEKSVNDKVKYIFGDSYKIKHENLICTLDNNSLYLYDANKKMYTYDTESVHGHGASGDVREIIIKYLKGIKDKDGKIVIDTKLVYATYCADTCGPNFAYYKSYEDSVNNKNPILGNGQDEIELNDKLYRNIEEQLPITTFTFIKVNSNTYNLDSVKIK